MVKENVRLGLSGERICRESMYSGACDHDQGSE